MEYRLRIQNWIRTRIHVRVWKKAIECSFKWRFMFYSIQYVVWNVYVDWSLNEYQVEERRMKKRKLQYWKTVSQPSRTVRNLKLEIIFLASRTIIYKLNTTVVTVSAGNMPRINALISIVVRTWLKYFENSAFLSSVQVAERSVVPGVRPGLGTDTPDFIGYHHSCICTGRTM